MPFQYKKRKNSTKDFHNFAMNWKMLKSDVFEINCYEAGYRQIYATPFLDKKFRFQIKLFNFVFTTAFADFLCYGHTSRSPNSNLHHTRGMTVIFKLFKKQDQHFFLLI